MLQTRTDAACTHCSLRAVSICRVANLPPEEGAGLCRSAMEHFRASETLQRGHRDTGTIKKIVAGWGFRYSLLCDGQRQITEFLLPGDIVSLAPLAGESPADTTQALTDITTCTFDVAALRDLLYRHPNGWSDILGIGFLRNNAMRSMLVNVAKSSARARIAHLLSEIYRLLRERRLVGHEPVFFPLRHHHIADALGLTPVHVTRLINTFEKQSLIRRLPSRYLAIDAPDKLADLAGESCRQA